MKIDHVAVVVQDIEKSLQFFQEIGFIIKKRNKLEGKWLDKLMKLPNVKAEYIALGFPNHETNLELLTFYSPKGKKEATLSIPNTIGFRHLAIEVPNIEEVVNKLKSKHIKFLTEVLNNPYGKKLCYFLGPEGIILELAEYGSSAG